MTRFELSNGMAFVSSLATRVMQTLLRHGERARMRRALRQLDDHLLHDIGLSRAEAMALADSLTTNPVWDAPLHWQTGQSRPKACTNPACDA